MTTDDLIVGRCYRLTSKRGDADWFIYLGVNQEWGWTCWLRRDGYAAIVAEDITGEMVSGEPPPADWLTVELDLATRRSREYWLVWAIERALGTANAALREERHGR